MQPILIACLDSDNIPHIVGLVTAEFAEDVATNAESFNCAIMQNYDFDYSL